MDEERKNLPNVFVLQGCLTKIGFIMQMAPNMKYFSFEHSHAFVKHNNIILLQLCVEKTSNVEAEDG